MVRDDIEEQLVERVPVRKQEPYYYAAEEELLPSYEDAVGLGVGEEGPEGRARIKYGWISVRFTSSSQVRARMTLLV